MLKRMDFRETSMIVNFYTKEFGKITGILKGIRGNPAKFASSLEPFSVNDIIFYSNNRSSLHLISECELQDNLALIRQNISKTASASIIIELIDAVMQPEDKNEEIFNLSLSCLKELENASNPDKITTIFKIKILSLSGFKPEFDACVSCGTKINGPSKFSLMLGGLLCPKCLTKDFKARSIFRGTIASILYIEKNDLRTSLNLGMNQDIKKELDIILNAFLHFHLEKELKSQKVFNKLDSPIPIAK